MNEYNSKFSLHGKTALITGSGRGIGKGLALALANAGADIVVLDLIEDNVHKTANQIESKYPVKVTPYVADLNRLEQIGKFVTEIAEVCGKVDILINNAGIQIRKPALDFSLEDWYRVINIHLTVSFLMSQNTARFMIANGSGNIINIASLNTLIASPHIIAYTAAKSGIAGLTRSMAVEWSANNIRVNAIAPGFAQTDLIQSLLKNKETKSAIMNRIPLNRIADPESDLGYVAVFLASEASQYITGQTIYVDGGFSIRL